MGQRCAPKTTVFSQAWNDFQETSKIQLPGSRKDLTWENVNENILYESDFNSVQQQPKLYRKYRS